MSRIAIFMADGFEEIEGLTVVDVLRRAGHVIDMVSIMPGIEITGAHDIKIQTDKLMNDIKWDEYDMFVLPGGGPGTARLKECQLLKDKLLEFANTDKYIAAICAAPTVLASIGLLDGKKACCYESCEGDLIGAEVVRDEVVQTGNIITSRGMGTAIAFSLKLVEVLSDADTAYNLGQSLMYRK